VNWHLLTVGLGTKEYNSAAERLAREARQANVFSTIIIENNKSLMKNHKLFFKAHENFIKRNNFIGYGKYLWKPYLLHYWLGNIPVGDGLLYLDAGCTLNLKFQPSKNRLKSYLVKAEHFGSLSFQLINNQFGDLKYSTNLKEKYWSDPRLIRHLALTKSQTESNQIESGVIFMLNIKKNRDLVKKWSDLTIFDDYKFLKTDSFYNDDNEIIYNRFDQSILSCLLKVNKFKHVPCETYFSPNWSKMGKYFPIWTTRLISGVSMTNLSAANSIRYFFEICFKAYRRILKFYRKILNSLT